MFKAGFDKPCNCVDRAYRIILMDIQMPQMNGVEATIEIIKMMGDGHPVDSSILAVTAYTSENTDEECRKEGMKAIMRKPATFDALSQEMARYWSKMNEE